MVSSGAEHHAGGFFVEFFEDFEKAGVVELDKRGEPLDAADVAGELRDDRVHLLEFGARTPGARRVRERGIGGRRQGFGAGLARTTR